jgi:hypothetical protein
MLKGELLEYSTWRKVMERRVVGKKGEENIAFDIIESILGGEMVEVAKYYIPQQ